MHTALDRLVVDEVKLGHAAQQQAVSELDAKRYRVGDLARVFQS
jgi:hypothetical protein